VQIGILGGGAAGFFAAITASETDPQARVTILEASASPLSKVRISGGGRCNVTHHCDDPTQLVTHYPRGAQELLGPFTRFGPRETSAWFHSRGVTLKTEADGRMFPTTDDSKTVVEALLKTAAGSGVTLLTGARVEAVECTFSDGRSRKFRLLGRGVPDRPFDRLLVATGNGSRGYRIAESVGHTIVPCMPSLFTFKVEDERIAGLAGVSFADVELTLQCGRGKELQQRGPLLITHWGLSGPAVLALSAWGARVLHAAGYRARLTVNFLPGQPAGGFRESLQAVKTQRGSARVQNEPQSGLPRRYWGRACARAGAGAETAWAHLTHRALDALVAELTAAEFAISGKGVFKEEFVTSGGVDLKEVDFRTMESKRSPNLYFAGEVLDIDGVTGGFNFQSAWTCGYIAGIHMARRAE